MRPSGSSKSTTDKTQKMCARRIRDKRRSRKLWKHALKHEAHKAKANLVVALLWREKEVKGDLNLAIFPPPGIHTQMSHSNGSMLCCYSVSSLFPLSTNIFQSIRANADGRHFLSTTIAPEDIELLLISRKLHIWQCGERESLRRPVQQYLVFHRAQIIFVWAYWFLVSVYDARSGKPAPALIASGRAAHFKGKDCDNWLVGAFTVRVQEIWKKGRTTLTVFLQVCGPSFEWKKRAHKVVERIPPSWSQKPVKVVVGAGVSDLSVVPCVIVISDSCAFLSMSVPTKETSGTAVLPALVLNRVPQIPVCNVIHCKRKKGDAHTMSDDDPEYVPMVTCIVNGGKPGYPTFETRAASAPSVTLAQVTHLTFVTILPSLSSSQWFTFLPQQPQASSGYPPMQQQHSASSYPQQQGGGPSRDQVFSPHWHQAMI